MRLRGTEYGVGAFWGRMIANPLQADDILIASFQLATCPGQVVVPQELREGDLRAAGLAMLGSPAWMYFAMILRAISRASSRVRCPADPSVRRFPCSQVTTQALCPLGCTRSRRPRTCVSLSSYARSLGWAVAARRLVRAVTDIRAASVVWLSQR